MIRLTENGEKLKDDALTVPGEMAGCIRMSEEELNTLRGLLNKAIFVMEEDTQ